MWLSIDRIHNKSFNFSGWPHLLVGEGIRCYENNAVDPMSKKKIESRILFLQISESYASGSSSSISPYFLHVRYHSILKTTTILSTYRKTLKCEVSARVHIWLGCHHKQWRESKHMSKSWSQYHSKHTKRNLDFRCIRVCLTPKFISNTVD